MALITVSDVPDFEEATYPLKIISVKPKKITPKRGDNAGQEIDILEWKAQMLEDDWKTPVLDAKTDEELVAKATSSLASGPRSKINGFLVALLGPSAVEPGLQFEEGDLVGKMALGSIIRDEGGFPKIDSLTARPRSRNVRTEVEPEETAAPARGRRQAVTPPPAEDDDLPF
jgi:hypothetical protein